MIFTHVPSRGVEEVGSPADRLLETLWSQYWAEPLAAVGGLATLSGAKR
jgi:hypothetical protein